MLPSLVVVVVVIVVVVAVVVVVVVVVVVSPLPLCACLPGPGPVQDGADPRVRVGRKGTVPHSLMHIHTHILSLTHLSQRRVGGSCCWFVFVLDEKGYKMSKSLGNVVDPRYNNNNNTHISSTHPFAATWWTHLACLSPSACTYPMP